MERIYIRVLGAATLAAFVFVMVKPARGANVTVSPTSVNFGNLTVGTASQPYPVTLTNYSKKDVQVVSVSISMPRVSYSGPSFPVTLAPGQSISGSVIFSPDAAVAYTGYLVFVHGNGAPISVSLSGVGIQLAASIPSQAPLITTQPASQTVTIGQAGTFTVAATGTAPLTYQWTKNGAVISGATSSSYTTPATTASDNGAQFTVVVSNSASNATSNAATLTVNAATILLNANPTSLSFGSITIGGSSTHSVTFTNAGNSNVTISNVSISGAGYTAGGVSTGQILPPAQTATLNVGFAPSATGTLTGSVTVTSDATNSPATISLSGTGVQAVSHSVALAWSPSTSSVVGYNVYRSTVSGGPYTKLNSAVVATISYEDSTVQAGQTYYYVGTSVNSSNVESAHSSQVAAAVPSP